MLREIMIGEIYETKNQENETLLCAEVDARLHNNAPSKQHPAELEIEFEVKRFYFKFGNYKDGYQELDANISNELSELWYGYIEQEVSKIDEKEFYKT